MGSFTLCSNWDIGTIILPETEFHLREYAERRGVTFLTYKFYEVFPEVIEVLLLCTPLNRFHSTTNDFLGISNGHG